MNKKWISVALTALLLISLLPVTSLAGEADEYPPPDNLPVTGSNNYNSLIWYIMLAPGMGALVGVIYLWRLSKKA